MAFSQQTGQRPPTKQCRKTDDADDRGEAMILRVWRAKIDSARLEEYRRFERERCLPMLRKQPGFLEVLFLRQAENRGASVTIWEDKGAVEALESSPSYRGTIRALAECGLLAGEQSVETFEVAGGDLRPEPLILALGYTDLRSSSKKATT
jgi:heme-degrading monooxygenase HmoA